MARSDRYIHRLVLIAGTFATLLVLLAYGAGLLDRLEGGLYDLRAQRFQHFMPPPTDKVVHLDIDDAALDAMGAWPWPRTLMAELMDEISAAGPKVLALDILYSEPQQREWKPLASVVVEPTAREATGTFELIDHDANLSAAFGRAGNVLLPASLLFIPAHAQSPAVSRATALLAEDLELPPATLQSALTAEGFSASDWTDVAAIFFDIRREAAQIRIRRELEKGLQPSTRPVRITNIQQLASSRPAAASRPASQPAERPTSTTHPADSSDAKDAALKLALREKLLPKHDPDAISPENAMLDDAYERVLASNALLRFGYPSSPDTPAYASKQQILPLPKLLKSARSTGFVDYPNFGDGTARRIALMMDYQGSRFLHISLQVACEMLEVDPKDLQVTETSITIPPGTLANGKPRRGLTIPVRTVQHVGAGGTVMTVPLEMNIPFFGPRQWMGMYDPAHPELKKQHISLSDVYGIVRTRKRIRAATAGADRAASVLLEFLDQNAPLPSGKRTDAFRPEALSSDGVEPKLKNYRQILQEIESILPPDIRSNDPTLHPRDRYFVGTAEALRMAVQELPKLQAQLAQQRQELRDRLHGNAVLVGWTSTSLLADALPTPLHPVAPGVVIHGVVINAILTGEVWRQVPSWMMLGVAAILGLLVTFAVARISPVRALAATAVLLVAYTLVNCSLLFDYGNQILELGTPLLAMIFAWAGATITRLIIEARERARITRRFATYVDPDIVNYFLEVRDETMFSGQRRDTTVVFTDLEGFTRLSNQLGEEIVPLLNDFMGRAVTVIKQHRGLVNKFLGDGILFFFNAPKPNATYIEDAVDAILDLQLMMVGFNEDLAKQNLPKLRLRAGVTTGRVIAGDAGTSDRADYTVIGDLVNLASRLESANKYFGTSNLITESTLKGAGDKFLFRPVGVIRVVGMETGVMTYETLAWMKDATDQQRQIARASAKVITAFDAGDAAACLAAIAELEAAEGPTKLSKAYRAICEPYASGEQHGAMPKEIVLSEK